MMLNYNPKGWIRLHRDLENQVIFRDAETMRFYIYLTCRAVTEPTTFRGIELTRGQTATTYGTLADELQLPLRRVRSLMEKLTSAHYLAHYQAYSGAYSFSVITICDYDKYQGSRKPSPHIKPHIDRHIPRQHPPVDTLYNEKEISTNVDNEEEVERKSTPSSDFEKVLIEKLIDDDVWKGKIAGAFGLDETTLIKRLDEFFISNECRGKFHKDLSDLKSHFVNWLKIILNPKTKNTDNNENHETERRDQRRGMDAGVHSASDFEGPF